MWDQLKRGQSQARVPSRASASRQTILALFVLGLGLLTIGRTDPQIFDDIKTSVADALRPVLEAAAQPVHKVRHWREATADMARVYEENERLKAENAALRAEAQGLKRLEVLVGRYEALLNVKIDPQINFTTARIIGDSGGPFARVVVVNIGAVDGVKRGQAVVDTQGLVGHVVTVGEKVSRVLLLTDIQSNIPVTLETSNAQAAVTGDGSVTPTLQFIPAGIVPKAGERIVTSGIGGLLPPGLSVGVVSQKPALDGRHRVTLAADFARLDFVRVLDYVPPALPEPEEAPALQPGATPPATPGSAPAPATPVSPPAADVPTAANTPAPAPAATPDEDSAPLPPDLAEAQTPPAGEGRAPSSSSGL